MTVPSLSKIAVQALYSVDFVHVVWESVFASLISKSLHHVRKDSWNEKAKFCIGQLSK